MISVEGSSIFILNNLGGGKIKPRFKSFKKFNPYNDYTIFQGVFEGESDPLPSTSLYVDVDKKGSVVSPCSKSSIALLWEHLNPDTPHSRT